MRRSSLSALVAALLVGAATAAALARPNLAAAAAAEPYTWKNVRIDGGGFVPAIVFNPGEKNLIYARTDIGGRLPVERGRPELDARCSTGSARTTGATTACSASPPTRSTPTGSTRPSACTPTSWDPNNGAILRSTDKGNTWQATTLPFKNGGNMPGRGMGERLAVDPHDNKNVYFAAEGGNGLWRSTDYGVTWAKVTNFPNVGNYVQDPTDTNDYLSQNQGLSWVTFGAAEPDLRGRGRQGRTRSTARSTAAPPGSASPASRPATSRTRAWSRATTSTSPPATPAARTTARAGQV